jgi:hypothetical protein
VPSRVRQSARSELLRSKAVRVTPAARSEHRHRLAESGLAAPMVGAGLPGLTLTSGGLLG